MADPGPPEENLFSYGFLNSIDAEFSNDQERDLSSRASDPETISSPPTTDSSPSSSPTNYSSPAPSVESHPNSDDLNWDLEPLFVSNCGEVYFFDAGIKSPKHAPVKFLWKLKLERVLTICGLYFGETPKVTCDRPGISSSFLSSFLSDSKISLPFNTE